MSLRQSFRFFGGILSSLLFLLSRGDSAPAEEDTTSRRSRRNRGDEDAATEVTVVFCFTKLMTDAYQWKGRHSEHCLGVTPLPLAFGVFPFLFLFCFYSLGGWVVETVHLPSLVFFHTGVA